MLGILTCFDCAIATKTKKRQGQPPGEVLIAVNIFIF